MKIRKLSLVSLTSLMMSAFATAFADPIQTTGNAAANTAAIQSAIDAAVPNGTVTLGEGEFTIDAQLMVTGGVTLVGQGWEQTTIKQTTSGQRVVTLDGGAKLQGVMVTGGKITSEWTSGAGVVVKNGTISWCRITGNTTGIGATVTVKECYGAGVSFYDGQGQIDHSIIDANISASHGGGSSYGGGIGIRNHTGPVTIDTCLIYGNSAPNGNGGGIAAYLQNSHERFTVRNSTIAGNSCSGQGGVYVVEYDNSSSLELVNCAFASNTVGSGDANIVLYTTKDVAAQRAAAEGKAFGNVFDAGTTFGANSKTVVGSGADWFVDDYHLKADSAPVGAGVTYTGIANDLDNKPFADPPSAGCYEAGDLVATPTFDPAADTEFYPTTNVTISCETAGATIRYTLDGTVPTTASAEYTAPIVLSATTTIKARAFADGISPSPVVTAKFLLVKPAPKPEEFSKCVEITLNTALATTEITTGLPALVKLDPENITGFSYADFTLENGGDMMFADANGHAIPHEIDTWNPEGESLVWVKLPSTAANTVIKLYYGKGTTTPAEKTDVWSDYVGVWHFETLDTSVKVANSQGTFANSTATADIDGNVSTYSVVGETGRFGNCFRVNDSTAKQAGNFNKGGVWVNDAGTDSPVDGGENFTISGWFKHGDFDYYYDHFFYKRSASNNGGSPNNAFAIESDSMNGDVKPKPRGSSGTGGSVVLSGNMKGSWSYLTFAFDGAKCHVYENGTFKGDSGITACVDNDCPLIFGDNNAVATGGGDAAWNGWIDEVRYAKGSQDANWIAAEYKAMNTAAADIFTFGEVQDIERPIEEIPVYTLTIPAKTGLVVESVKTNDVPVVGVDNGYSIVSNTAVSITFAAESGYEITGGANPVVVTVEADMTLADSLYPTVREIVTPGAPITPKATAALTRQAIQSAIDAAAVSADPTEKTVTLAVGEFLIDAQLTVTGGVTLVGQGWEQTTVKQTTSGQRVVTVGENSKLQGVTVTGGKIDEKWTYGAGVFVDGGMVSFCRVTKNSSTGTGAGGVGVGLAKGSVEHCIIDNNKSTGDSTVGGGVGLNIPNGPVFVDACLIYGNFAKNGGGIGAAFDNSHYLLTVRNTTIANNTAGDNGCALYERQNISGTKYDLKLVNCVIADNQSESVAGIMFYSYGGDDKAAQARAGCEAQSSGNVLANGLTFGANSTSVAGSGAGWFVDAANGDYHVVVDSPVNGKGTSVDGSRVDLDGVSFCEPTSVGCYELHVRLGEPEFTYPASRQAEGTFRLLNLGQKAESATVKFAYGPVAAGLGSATTVSSVATTNDELSVSLTGLAPQAVYAYRVTAMDNDGVESECVREGTFVTPEWDVVTLGNPEVADITEASARPAVSLAKLGEGATSAKVTFSWGTDPTALSDSRVLSTSAHVGDVFGETVGGLTANTKYYFAFTAENDASPSDSTTVSGSFWTSNTSILSGDRSAEYPTVCPTGKAVTYDADNAGDPVTLDPGMPFCVVNAANYPYAYNSSAGRSFAFRDDSDFRYNASARIGGNYYLFIEDAVAAAKSGDTIELLRNNYAIGSTMEIATKLTINGNGYAVKVAHPFMDAQGFVDTNCTESVKTVFHIANGGDVRLDDMTIMGGGERLGPDEVGSDNATTPAITVCNDVNGARNQAGSTGILEMDHVTITRSQGGLWSADGTKVYADACNLVRNARYCGGGLFNRGLLVMVNSSLSENRSLHVEGGGAAAENQGSLFMNNCVICNNGSTEYGGAINMLANTYISGNHNCVAYLMNVTLAGNFTSATANKGGGIGCHQGSDELYVVNSILCNNYQYNTNTSAIVASDIRADAGNNRFYYTVYVNSTQNGGSTEFPGCWQLNANAETVFKGYSPFVRTYEQNKKTSVEITAPALENDANQPLARYAPLLVDGAADVGTAGVYTYFDASNWREWTDSLDVSAIKMSYRTEGGEMTALGKCVAAEESDKVTTYYETAFNPNVVDRELGVIGASGFGNEKRSFTLYLLRQPENGSVNRELTLQGTSYLEGSEVTVVATPNAACSFVGWYDEKDDLLSSSASYTFTMDSDKKLYALFTPPSPTRIFNVDCEQATDGTHGKFPITITTNWLAAAFSSICPGGIVPDSKVSEVEAALNAPDAGNGLNHVWMNYVLGAMLPGDEDGRIWIRADQTRDASTLRLRTQTFSQTKDCGFTVAYRLLKKSPTEADFVRGDVYASSASFDAPIASDTITHRVIDMIFIPSGYDTSCEYVTTVNTAGVMKVESAKTNEILAVPWVGFSPTNSPAVKATDYAKASCLSEGDVLYVYDRENQNYLAWSVQNDGTWKSVKTYNLVNGVVTESDVDASRTNAIPRGTGVWLERHDTMKPIYLYGQVDDSPVTTSLAPGFNLVANPYLTAFDASKLARPATTGEDGDRIVIPTGGAPINCTYDPDKGWGWLDYVEQELKNKKGEPILDPVTKEPLTGVTAVWKSEGMTLPVGHGFWYYNGGTTDGEIGWPSSQEDAQ